MYQYLIDLFVCLNLQIKNQNYLDMDDFLYFFDNFSFFIEDDKIFKKMTEECFRWINNYFIIDYTERDRFHDGRIYCIRFPFFYWVIST